MCDKLTAVHGAAATLWAASLLRGTQGDEGGGGPTASRPHGGVAAGGGRWRPVIEGAQAPALTREDLLALLR